MPENDAPSTKPNPEAPAGEFDFAAPITERPRVKRRALEQATPAKPEEAAPAKTAEARPAASAAKSAPASASNTPYYQPSSTAAKAKAAGQQTSPHGTRPATLYYSSGTRSDKDTPSTPPMKTTPSASPAPSTTSAAPAPAARTAAPAATTRSTSTVDYRTNVDRQAREQKSVGGILTILVYSLIFLFVSGACLATYGMYVITKQLNQQSVTMTDFDARYSTDYKDINSRLVITMDNLTSAQATIAKQQEIITKQQEALVKILATVDDNAAALRQERATRAQETANIRSRLKDLEYSGPSTTTRKY